MAFLLPNLQSANLRNISPPLPGRDAFSRPYPHLCDYRPQVGLPTSWWLFIHDLQKRKQRWVTSVLMIARLHCQVASCVNPDLLASASKEQLLIHLFYILEFGWKISLKWKHVDLKNKMTLQPPTASWNPNCLSWQTEPSIDSPILARSLISCHFFCNVYFKPSELLDRPAIHQGLHCWDYLYDFPVLSNPYPTMKT